MQHYNPSDSGTSNCQKVKSLVMLLLLMMLQSFMSSEVGWHIRDKLRPTREHGSILLYVHGNRKAR